MRQIPAQFASQIRRSGNRDRLKRGEAEWAFLTAFSKYAATMADMWLRIFRRPAEHRA